MQSDDIIDGQQYAYRKSTRSRDPFQRIKALEHVTTSRGKWKVRFLDDPYPGLEEYVRSACIVCPWSQVKKLERFERRLDRVQALTDTQYPARDHPLAEAVDLIFESTGEDIGIWNSGQFRGATDAVQRVADRARVDLDGHGVAFEHEGTSIAPFATGLELARAFAAAEPSTVHRHIDLIQRRYEQEMMEPGSAYLEPLVNRWRAGWALARQWAGHDAAINRRDAEISELRELVRRHIWDLRYRFRENEEIQRMAAKLERATRGG